MNLLRGHSVRQTIVPFVSGDLSCAEEPIHESYPRVGVVFAVAHAAHPVQRAVREASMVRRSPPLILRPSSSARLR
jgi:hypothetical protein